MKKIITLLLILIIVSISFISFASEIYIDQQYNFNFYGDAVPSPPGYSFTKQVSGRDMGIDNLRAPEDMYISEKGIIYILDSGSNQVVICDLYFNIIEILSEFEFPDGTKTKLNGPMGIYVDEKTDEIYIADTNNFRVIVVTQDGKVINTLGVDDESNTTGITRAFQPQKVVLDITDSFAVIASGVNEGVMQFSKDGEFLGFLGAPSAKVDLVRLFWRNFMTVEQKAKTSLFTPIVYSNIDIDDKGCFYATVRTTDFKVIQKFRRINPGGHDITRALGVFPPNGDPFPIIINLNTNPIQFRSTMFVDVVSHDNGFYSLLDQTMGRVFTYDYDGNLLYVFGNKGTSLGTFNYPVAIDKNGDNLYVLDRNLGTINVFTITQYGKDLELASIYYQEGEYDKSIKLYQNIINNNINSEIGYIGLGNNLLILGEHSEALRAFRLGNYRLGYNDAFQGLRRQFVSDNFRIIFFIGVFLISSIMGLILYYTRENIKPNPIKRNYLGSLKYSLHIIFHPFDGFWDMKNETRGSIAAANTILVAFVFTYIINKQYSGFLFNTTDLRFFNLPREIFIVLFAITLWLVANTSVASWIYGEGKFKYVYMYTCYSLTPIVILMSFATLVSNFMLLDESVIYRFLIGLSLIWFISLIFIGNIQIHQYPLKTSAKHMIVSFIQIAVMLFLVLVGISLIQQIISFINIIYTEISIR